MLECAGFKLVSGAEIDFQLGVSRQPAEGVELEVRKRDCESRPKRPGSSPNTSVAPRATVGRLSQKSYIPDDNSGAMAPVEPRGNGIRAVAVIIDIVVWAVIGYVIAVATGSTTGSGFELEGVPALLWYVSFFVYYIVLEAEIGQTLGKKAVGIKVVTETGDPIDYRASLVRNVLRIVDGLFFYLVGAIFVYRSADAQRLGDRIANTVVVSADAADAAEPHVEPGES